MALGYRIEFLTLAGKWFAGAGSACGLTYARGYLDCMRNGPTPRIGARIVREKDGKVMEELPAVESVGIGMVAGFPSWEQYARAGAVALERATLIAEREKRPLVAQKLKDCAWLVRHALGWSR